jgi:hypothetical protein
VAGSPEIIAEFVRLNVDVIETAPASLAASLASHIPTTGRDQAKGLRRARLDHLRQRHARLL